jgi:hypothetical protein
VAEIARIDYCETFVLANRKIEVRINVVYEKGPTMSLAAMSSLPVA